jgi:hypothetical protein
MTRSHLKIFKTYNYSLFKKMKGNRDIDESHLKKIIKSIEEDGYTFSPIQVNEKYEVIEGQHRLEACRALKLPIYYHVVAGATIRDVTILNHNRKNWGFDQWLNRYVAYNKQEYKIYKHFYDKWGFDHWSTIFLLCRTKGLRGRGPLKKHFEQGLLKIETLEEGKAWANRILDVKPFYSNYKRRAFIQAMIRVFHDRTYNHKMFLKKLSLVRDRLYDCSTVGLYLQRIDDIMNYSTPKNKRTTFAQRWGDADSIFTAHVR